MSTTAFPAATAKAAWVSGIPSGKFQGEITPITPSGSYSSHPRLCRRSGCVNRRRSARSTRGAFEAAQTRLSSDTNSSAVYDSTSGFPVSAVTVAVSRSARASTSCATAPSSSRRSANDDLAHRSAATRASAAASETSSGGETGTEPSSSKVAGSTERSSSTCVSRPIARS